MGEGRGGRAARARRGVGRLLAAMRRERGYIYPEWERLAREAPEFLAAYEALYRAALARDAGLPVKYRELVALGILAFRGEPQGLVNHIRRALQHGATRAEILGALQATIVPGGALTFLNGLRALAAVDAEAAGDGRRASAGGAASGGGAGPGRRAVAGTRAASGSGGAPGGAAASGGDAARAGGAASGGGPAGGGDPPGRGTGPARRRRKGR